MSIMATGGMATGGSGSSLADSHCSSVGRRPMEHSHISFAFVSRSRKFVI